MMVMPAQLCDIIIIYYTTMAALIPLDCGQHLSYDDVVW